MAAKAARYSQGTRVLPFTIIRLMDNEFKSQPAKDKIAKKRIILYRSIFPPY